MARPARIRSTLTRMMLVIGGLAVVAAVALTALTSKLQQIGETTSAAVESVRLGHEVQIDLMLYERTVNGLVRTDMAADLHRRLADAREHIASPRESELLARAVASIDAYLHAVHTDGGAVHEAELQEAAHAAVREFVDMNVLEARAARDVASRWDVLADVLAALLVLANLGAGGWLVWWIRTHTVAPLLAFTDTVERFGRGDKAARADESGPLELREVAARFNRMADTLASQRSGQIAHLAAVAHDLRNPLWALQLSLQSVRQGDARDGERTRRSLDVAERQVARLGRMIDDLLDASNIEAGNLELREGMHDLCDIVRELGDQFGGASAKHRLECIVPSEPLRAVIDPLRIGQVVTNLLTNAIKYSPAGGVVRLELRRDDDVAVIEVADEGLGIDAVELPEVFEPFRRLSAGKRSSAGTGLGLFVVRRLVEAHGGEIRVDSVPGRGSTFMVRLPLVESATSADNDVARTGTPERG